MRVLDQRAVAATCAAAGAASRRRANLNLHPTLADPVQRMLNVFQPGTYVRPHRHDPGRFELFLILTGKAAVLTFGDDGKVEASAVLEPGRIWAVELPGLVWHTLVSLAADTALFEVKPGPYAPLDESHFAPWAPADGRPEAQRLLDEWMRRLAACAEAPPGPAAR